MSFQLFLFHRQPEKQSPLTPLLLSTFLSLFSLPMNFMLLSVVLSAKTCSNLNVLAENLDYLLKLCCFCKERSLRNKLAASINSVNGMKYISYL